MDVTSPAQPPATSRGRQVNVPPFLLKVLVTAFIGAIGYLLTNIAHEPQTWKLTVSVFLSGVVLVIQYMIDFERRLDSAERAMAAHNSDMKELVARGFARINEVTELFGLVDRSALPPEEITGMLRHAARIDSGAPPIMQAFAREEMRAFSLLLQNLNQRSVDYDGEQHDWLLALTRCASATIDATSSSIDDDFWPSEPGRRYLAVQREAGARGVRVRRLFIVDTRDQRTPELARLCAEQQALGVEVRVVVLSELPPVASMRDTYDFILFDDQMSYETSSDLRRSYTRTYTDWRPERVAGRAQRFRELWEVAELP